MTSASGDVLVSSVVCLVAKQVRSAAEQLAASADRGIVRGKEDKRRQLLGQLLCKLLQGRAFASSAAAAPTVVGVVTSSSSAREESVG